MDWLDEVRWDEHGLLPVIAQEHATGDVLMFAWMNREALAETAATGRAVYWSRSRQRLCARARNQAMCRQVHAMRLDCDADVLLLRVTQHGSGPGEPAIACHTGRHSCFFRELQDGAWHTVAAVLKDPEHIYK